MTGIWTLLLRRPRIVWMIIGALLIFGGQAWSSIPRETAPEVEIPTATVTTIWPGAGVNEVETLVTDVLERKIDGIENLQQYDSVSRRGVSIISIEFQSGTDMTENVNNLKDRVDAAKGELPSEVPDDPTVAEISISDSPVLSLTMSGDYAWSDLRRFAQVVEDTLETVGQVKRVSVSGAPEPEVQILLDPLKMEALQISPGTVINAIRAYDTEVPLGQANIDGQQVELSISSQLETVSDFLEIPVGGDPTSVISLSEIATVKRSFAAFEVQSFFTKGANANPAVSIDVIKSATKGNAIVMVEEALAALEELKESGAIPPLVDMTVTYDRADEIRDSLGTLTNSGGQTLILIMFVMLIALGWRESFLSGASIPLSLLIAIIGLLAMGESFNGISLFALVLAVGLLVDNSIIIVEGLNEGIERGLTPYDAAVETIQTFRYPILTGTLTTIFAFLPMLFFITGISGDYISIIPITVSLVLVGAFIVSLFLLPAIGVAFYDTKSTGFFLSRWGLLFYSIWGIFAVIQLLTGSWQPLATWASLILIGGALYGLRWLIGRFGNPLTFDWAAWINPKPRWQRIALLLILWAILIIGIVLVLQWNPGILAFKWIALALLGLFGLSFVNAQYKQFLNWCYRVYPIWMEKILNSGWKNGLVVLASVVCFGGAMGLVASKAVPVEVFPASDFPYFAGELELPEGTPLEETASYISLIQQTAAEYFESNESATPWLESITFIAGGRSTLVQEIGDVRGGSEPNLLGMSFELTDEEIRGVKSYDVAEQIEENIVAQLPDFAKFRIVEQEGGPPTGAPVEVRLQGDDIARLDALTSALGAKLKTINELENVRDTRAEKVVQVTWRFDQAVMQQFGLTPGAITGAARAAAEGSTAMTITEGEDEIDVVLKYDWGNGKWSDPDSLDLIGSTPIVTPNGAVVQLNQVATPEINGRISQVSHRDGNPILAVRADLPQGITASELADQVQVAIDQLELLPGESVDIGGEAEEGNRLINEMILAMSFAALLILLVLVWQFQSFHQAVVVLSLVPLSLTGVFVGFWLTGRTITFPTMIGIVSLAGIIVNDAIVLIDQLNKQPTDPENPYAGWIRAGVSRFQPILLTSITTVVGMLPLSLSDEVWGGLGFAIIYGMAISTILCLVLAPCLLRLWNDIVRLRDWVWQKVVERPVPATQTN